MVKQPRGTQRYRPTQRDDEDRPTQAIVTLAIVAAIGNGAAFRKGRDFAAWLGVVPRQYSTGGKARLLGISKRGNVYLRKILIHGHGHGLRYCGSSGIGRPSEPGWMRSMPAPLYRTTAAA